MEIRNVKYIQIELIRMAMAEFHCEGSAGCGAVGERYMCVALLQGISMLIDCDHELSSGECEEP